MSVDDSYTKALLHFGGADASTIFTDESGKIWTATGGAQLDTDQKKFGSASGLFDTSGDSISTPDHADFAMGTGLFTIDFWIRLKEDVYAYGDNFSLQTNGMLFYQGDASGTGTTILQAAWLYKDAVGTKHLRWDMPESPESFPGDHSLFVTTVGFVINTWYHLAFVRDASNTFRIFVNGVLKVQDPRSKTLTDSTYHFVIGSMPSPTFLHYFDGWIEEFRFSKGIARWSANFTPPASAYGIIQRVSQPRKLEVAYPEGTGAVSFPRRLEVAYPEGNGRLSFPRELEVRTLFR